MVLIDLSDVASIQSARASLTSIIEKTSEVAELSSAIGAALQLMSSVSVGYSPWSWSIKIFYNMGSEFDNIAD